jgi:hypothetical protein
MRSRRWYRQRLAHAYWRGCARAATEITAPERRAEVSKNAGSFADRTALEQDHAVPLPLHEFVIDAHDLCA